MSDAPITLELTVSELDGDTVVRAAGELDVNTAPELREQLARLIAEDARQIVIDLTEVSFVALHSHPGRSSPTIRGKALREVFLCQKVPDPPGNVNFALVQDTKNPAQTCLFSHK